MPFYFQLYGVHGDSLEAVKDRVADLFSVGFTEHDSEFRGDYWQHEPDGPDGYIITVAINEDPEDGLPLYDKAPDYPYLVYILSSEDRDGDKRKLEGDPLLRATEIEVDQVE